MLFFKIGIANTVHAAKVGNYDESDLTGIISKVSEKIGAHYQITILVELT
jgi:hypothetical protein